MRSESYNLSLALVGILALICLSCGRADQSAGQDQQPEFTGAAQTGLVEDSGKRLSGEFVFQVVEDSYAPKDAADPQSRVFTFDEDGNFKSEKYVRSTATVEEGSYLIDKQGELVLYYDKVSGAMLESARLERYNIISQTDVLLRLVQPPTKSFVLRKR
jgi:hypothetical protein